MRDSRTAAVAALLAAAIVLSTVALPTGTASADDDAVTIDYDGDAVTVAAGQSQVISGNSTLPAGTSISVQVQSTGDTQPRFFQTASATVDRDGTWAATFDFSEQSPNGTFEVTAKADGSEARADGELVECEGDCEDEAPEQVETVRIDTSNGTVEVNDSESQVISGSALAPTGTEVSLRLRSTQSEIQFFKTATAVVTEDGTWASAFDFSGIGPGNEFAVEATIDGEYVAEADGTVVDCEADCRDQPPTDTPTPIPTATPEGTAAPSADGDVAFTESTVRVLQNETVEFRLRLDGTDSAGIVIGDAAESGYSLEATVEDRDGDGYVTVQFDTAAAGGAGDPIDATGEDEAVVDSETELPAPLATGDYEMLVYPEGGDANAPADLASLFVAEPGTATPGTATVAADGSTTPTPTSNGSPIGIVVSGTLVLCGGALALLLLRG